MKTHPATDVAKVTAAFLSVASGENEKSKREAGIAQTRQDIRLSRAFAEDGASLPTGALTMESHLDYRFCNIPGTEPPEVLTLYNEIRAHAGTWPSHEQSSKDRCDAMLFVARNLVDDCGEVLDSLEEGVPHEAKRGQLRALLEGAHERAGVEAKLAQDTSRALFEFRENIIGNLAPRIEDKFVIMKDGPHDTEVFGQRAKLRRQVKDINDKERAFVRAHDADGFNLMGRRLERTIYGSAAIAANDELETAIYEYKKTIGQVAIPHRLLKSLGLRRAAMANAALAARSGGQALQHLATTWATTAAALEEILTEYDAAKTKAHFAAVAAKLSPLVENWDKAEGLAEHTDYIFSL